MSDGTRKRGIQFNPGDTFMYPYWEKVYDYSGNTENRVTGKEAVDNIEQTPLDRQAAKVIEYDLVAIAAQFEAEWIVQPGKTVVRNLPDVITAVNVTFNKTVGSGESNFPVSQQAFQITVRGNGSINPRATAEGTASILPSVTPVIIDWYKEKYVNCTHYYFYVPQESTLAVILAKLTTKAGVPVTDFPDFRPVSHRLKVLGQQVSVQASAQSEASLAFTIEGAAITSETAAYQWGNGFSKSNGVSEKIEVWPKAIHAVLAIGSNTDNQAVSATVVANTIPLYIEAAEQVATIVNEPAATTATATGTVLFENDMDSVPATGGVTSIPVTGLRIVELDSESDERFGFTKIHAVVVDFVQYA